MLKGLTGGKGTVVNNGSSSWPYISSNSNNPIHGMLRLNGSDLQVFDGSTWLNMSSSWASVELDADTHSLLEWARLERTKQKVMAERIEQNPALKKAYEAVVRAQENFDILDKIVGDDNSAGKMIYPGGGLPVTP